MKEDRCVDRGRASSQWMAVVAAKPFRPETRTTFGAYFKPYQIPPFSPFIAFQIFKTIHEAIAMKSKALAASILRHQSLDNFLHKGIHVAKK